MSGAWVSRRSNRSTDTFEFEYDGHAKPGLEVASNSPRNTRVFTLLARNDLLVTPRNVTAAVSDPLPTTIEFVPEPEHGIPLRQVNTPLVVSTTLKASSPLGRMVYGSARARFAEPMHISSATVKTLILIFSVFCSF